ncbi:MAG: hypothetical protein WCO57_09695 [Verrucomicrobiota bacterium]
MSRRSRRRRGNLSSGWTGRVAVTLLLVCVVCAAVGYWSLKHYLHSDGFRYLLSAKVSKALGMQGEFSPFRWDGLVVETGAFEATGNSLIRSLHADRLHAEVNLSGVRRGVWELHGASVNRVEVNLDARKRLATDSPVPSLVEEPPVKPRKNGWLPNEVEVDGADLRELAARVLLDNGEVYANGMRVRVDRAGDKHTYLVEVNDGRIRLPWSWLPEVNLDRVRLRYQKSGLFVTDATASVFKQGRLNGSGEWNARDQQFSFEGNVRSVKCDELVNADWAKHLAGDAASSFVIEGHGAALVAKGTLTIKNGVLTALPVLDSLAAYADTRRFRVLALNEAHADWRWQAGDFTFSNLVVSSESLVRLEGRLVIRGRELDGTFRLGLAPGTLAAIPGAETDVFLAGERNMLWTPLRITGTLDDPHEDLTTRLLAAAQGRMFEVIPETGEKVLKFTHSILNDSGIIEKGTQVIDKTPDTLLQGAGGLLNGLFGGGSPPANPPPPASPKPE